VVRAKDGFKPEFVRYKAHEVFPEQAIEMGKAIREHADGFVPWLRNNQDIVGDGITGQALLRKYEVKTSLGET
jgi:hypothetical protein